MGMPEFPEPAALRPEGPFLGKAAEVATAFIALGQGLAIQRLIDARSVPDGLLGDTFALIYAGHLARSQA